MITNKLAVIILFKFNHQTLFPIWSLWVGKVVNIRVAYGNTEMQQSDNICLECLSKLTLFEFPQVAYARQVFFMFCAD